MARETEIPIAAITKGSVMPKLKTVKKPVRELTTQQICDELQSLQRRRVQVIKSRIMQENRLVATVACEMGYSSGLEEAERTKAFNAARALIKEIEDGDDSTELHQRMHGLVTGCRFGIEGFEHHQKHLEKLQIALVKMLPIVAWIEAPQQRGIGLQFIASIIGETGNLSNYPNPAKVWKRMGCAPHTFDGKTLMGGTWKSKTQGTLPASEWEAYGYSPRRRSIAFCIGENIVKQNGTIKVDEASIESDGHRVGPYRRRFDEAKASIREKHPDYTLMRCHRHGMLLATKLLLKNLWIEWHNSVKD